MAKELDSLCLIPARGGSKRLERKNIRLFHGKPLIAYTIEAAVDCGRFDRICVSTEDPEIASIAEKNGAEVPFQRPPELATDTAQVVDVTKQALDFFDENGQSYDVLGVLLPTSPLRDGDDLSAAYDKFAADEEAEFLMCVTEFIYSPFEALEMRDRRLARFWDEGEYYSRRSQEVPDIYVDNGGAYIMEVDAFRRELTFYGSELIGHPMPLERSIDIDNQFDFDLAEWLYEREQRGQA